MNNKHLILMHIHLLLDILFNVLYFFGIKKTFRGKVNVLKIRYMMYNFFFVDKEDMMYNLKHVFGLKLDK